MINRIYRIMEVGDSSWRAECKSPVVLSPNSVNSVNAVSKQTGAEGFQTHD